MLLTRHEMNTTTSLSEHRYKALKQSMDKQREQFYIEVARLQKQFKDGGIPKGFKGNNDRFIFPTEKIN